METAIHSREIRKDNPVLRKIGRVVIWILLIALAVFTLIPFVWMISSSLKLDREVFAFPMRWVPETFHWENYSLIWQKVPLLTYFKNTAFIAIVVTILQTLTSSFAAYAFAKLNFRGRDALFLCYIGTIAVPWQAYMLPQFIMMRSMGLYDTLWAMVVLQAFSAFGVFLMRQFYRSIPTELCEAARLDGLSEYGIWARIMLPLGDLHVREYLERLHGPHDLPDPGREQDRAGGPAAVYPGELQRLPPDHGGFPLFAAAGFHRVPVPAAVFH